MDCTPAVLSGRIFSGDKAFWLQYLNRSILQNHAQTDVDVIGICVAARIQYEPTLTDFHLIGKYRLGNAVRSRSLCGWPCDKLSTRIVEGVDAFGRIPLPFFQRFQIATQAPLAAIFTICSPDQAGIYRQALPIFFRESSDPLRNRCPLAGIRVDGPGFRRIGGSLRSYNCYMTGCTRFPGCCSDDRLARGYCRYSAVLDRCHCRIGGQPNDLAPIGGSCRQFFYFANI